MIENYRGAVDQFGVPTFIFGAHGEDFFALLGRAIAVSAVVERDLRTLARKLIAPIEETTQKFAISKLIESARKNLTPVECLEDREVVSEFLDKAGSLFLRRNEYAHSLWPAGSLEFGTQIVGWKSEPWKSELDLGDDLRVLRDDVKQLVGLVVQWNYEILRIISPMPWLQTPEETS